MAQSFNSPKLPAKPGLWPQETHRHTRSFAEKKVYDALKKSIPKGWFAWHSLRLRSHETGEFGEEDFVIADPNRPSILLVEVKGGHIEQDDGQWYQNGKPLNPPPLEQALNFRTKLIDRLRETGVKCPEIGAAVCFPDTDFDEQPTEDDLNGLVIGGRELQYLDETLKVTMERAVPSPWRRGNGNWIKAIHEIWGETWVPTLTLASRIKCEEDQRVRLDENQINILDAISDNDRVLICGPAGSGKTILAREAALRRAREGARILLLCFTDALCRWLGESITHPNITVMTVRRLAVKLLNDAGQKVIPIDSPEFWGNVSLRAAVDALPPFEDLWDRVVVDEGQDFDEDDWVLVSECARKSDRLWVFSDDAQAFWEDRKIPKEIEQKLFRYNLTEPYRCPPPIQNLTDCYAGRCELNPQLLKEGADANIIRVVTSSKEAVVKQVEKEINRLLGEGLKPQDIAVISVRGRDATESIVHNNKLNGHKVVPATDPDADSEIVCDTFLRFKGLEKPAVIVTDLRLVSNLYETRMHIAVSRPLNLLRIVGPETEIRKDPRLADLV